MSVLSIIQQHCKLNALAVPTAVVGSSDTAVVQLLAALQEVLEIMVRESKFNVIEQEKVFVATATEDQGSLSTLAANGYQRAVYETFFDRTNRRPLYGPLNETEWQQLKALPNAGVMYKFRIMGDHLLLNPVPTAPLPTIAFEYVSAWYIKDSGGTLKAAITADSDVPVFPESIVRAGLRFFWKQTKGLPYQADEKTFWDMLNNYIATDKVKRRVNLAEDIPVDLKPGVFVPSNTWNVH